MATQNKTDIDQLLADSLKQLASKKLLEKITIKEITDLAGVIRPTFYNHFQDKFELLEWIIKKELLEPVQPLIRTATSTEAMLLLFTNIERDKAFYSHVVKLEGPVTFRSIASKCVREVLLTIINEQMTGKESKHKWLTPEIISAYYAESLCFVAETWINQNMVLPPKEMAEAYQYMITRSMMDIIKEL